MFGAKELKPRIKVTDTTVECPVKGCLRKVARQVGRFIDKDWRFRCPEHNIYPSRSGATFVYTDKSDNLLWTDLQDQTLFDAIMPFKRESRMEHDNSEDAVTWNVFRYIEKISQLSDFLSSMIRAPVTNAELVYWSYSQREQGVWPDLKMSRKEFGESPQRSSEPDLIVVAENQLFWIEAKFTSDNETPRKDNADRKKYETGGGGWFPNVISSSYTSIATDEKKYELLRFWLLGSWAATQSHRAFHLVNLVRSDHEKDIEHRFGRHIKTDSNRTFIRWTWESVYDYISMNSPASRDKQKFMTYFENKTTGYDKDGKLQPAFNL